VGETVSGAAVQGISMLDPRRWGGQSNAPEGYRRGGKTGILWEGPDDDDEKDEDPVPDGDSIRAVSVAETETSAMSVSTAATVSTNVTSISPKKDIYDNLQLLLSLDLTLELIHAARDSLKRVETFVGYPGVYGHRVQDTIEDVAVSLLSVLSDRHIRNGFDQYVTSISMEIALHSQNWNSRAITQMRTYQPPVVQEGGDEVSPASTSVAPLVQFFELVHIGDTIQSIVQVYFDKELVRFIRLPMMNFVYVLRRPHMSMYLISYIA
jgi:recyclin-1